MYESRLQNPRYIEVAFKYVCWSYLHIMRTMVDGHVISTKEDTNA